MSVTIDYRQQLLEEISNLSPQELEKIYQVVVFLKEEFILLEQDRVEEAKACLEQLRQGGM